MTAKTSISLTDDQETYARALVESGQFPSLSAVLQRGLEMLRRDNDMREAELQALRSLIDQRRTGAFVDLATGEAETRAMLERKRKSACDAIGSAARRTSRATSTLLKSIWVRVYQELGDDLEDAIERAAARTDDALAYMRTFSAHPHRGTEHKAIRPGVRSVTNKSFVFYFEIDELSSGVRIFATFFGGARPPASDPGSLSTLTPCGFSGSRRGRVRSERAWFEAGASQRTAKPAGSAPRRRYRGRGGRSTQPRTIRAARRKWRQDPAYPASCTPAFTGTRKAMAAAALSRASIARGVVEGDRDTESAR